MKCTMVMRGGMVAQARQEGAGREKELPPFAMLRAFDMVVRLGGIRRAAQMLGLHHSVVSRHLAQLEAWLGVALLEWSGRHFAPTPAGARFHARISGAIAEMALATREIMGEEAGKPLRIWCSPGLLVEWLAAEVVAFEREFPHFRLDVRPAERPANLLMHEADVNIFMHLERELEAGVEKGLRAQVLARPAAMMAASPVLVAQLSWVKEARDLLRVPLLHGAHRQDWHWWLSSNGVEVPGELAGDLCWNPHMALEAARLGRGVLLSNRFFCRRDVARGDLAELRIPGGTNRAFGGYLFVAREERWSRPAMAGLRRFLLRRMKRLEEV